MSIASEITRLYGVRGDIFHAIEEKGVTVPAGSALDDCPGLIADIPSGSSGVYILDEVPTDDFGYDGDFAIVMQNLISGDNGTIIPIQDSSSTNCIANSSNTTAYNAFDGNNNTSYNFTKPGYIGYDFGENPKKIKSISINPGSYNSDPYYTYLKFFFFQASNDRINWNTLSCSTLPQSGGWFTCTFNNDNFYRYYRVFAYSTYYLYNITVREIHMNDEEPIITGSSQPSIFKKRLGVWSTSSEFSNWNLVSPQYGLYRPQGVSRLPKTLIDGLYDYTTDSTVSVKARINPSMLSYGTQQVLVGTAQNAGSFSGGVLSIFFEMNSEREYVQLYIAHGPNTQQRFRESILTSDFINSTFFEAEANAGTIKIYLDNTLKATLTLDNYTDQTGIITSYSFTGYANASSPGSPQMGVERITAKRNSDNHIEFDFVAAKDSITGALGFLDRLYNIWYSVTGVSELPGVQ